MDFQTVLENRRSVRSYRMPTTRKHALRVFELSRCSPNLHASMRFFLATRVKGQQLKSLSLPHFHISL